MFFACRKNRGVSFILTLTVLLFAAPEANPHPHMFLESTVTFRLSEQGIEGIELYWVFDNFFSQMIIADYDRDRNGHLSAKEILAVKSGAFDNLRHYNYFAEFWWQGIKSYPKTIEEFTALIRPGNILSYSFFIPFKVPVKGVSGELRVTVYDETFYVACSPSGNHKVSPADNPKFITSISIEESAIKPIYPGQFMPSQVVLRIKER